MEELIKLKAYLKQIQLLARIKLNKIELAIILK